MFSREQFEELFVEYYDLELSFYIFINNPDIFIFKSYWFDKSAMGLALYKDSNTEYVKFGFYDRLRNSHLHHVFECCSLNHNGIIDILSGHGYIFGINDNHITPEIINLLLETINPITPERLSSVYNLR